MTDENATWLDAVRVLLAAGHGAAASAVLETAAVAYPDDPRPWIAAAERAAMADDYVACRLAVGALVRRGAPDVLEPCLTDDPDIAFRLAQLWLSVDGRDRRSRAWSVRCLERFTWYVPPVPSGLTPEAYAASVAPFLAQRAQDAPHPAEALTFWNDWLHPTDGPELRGEVLMTQVGAHHPDFWGARRVLDYYRQGMDEAAAGDRLGLLPTFEEDGAYGVLRFRLGDGRVVSQDQILSAQDINLMADWVGLRAGDAPLLIDIGAGYGRMTHRFLRAFPSSYAMALDAVPGTSALAWQYLNFRGCGGRAVIGGPRRLLDALPPGAPRIAVNIHSWSEAPLASVQGWLDLLVTAQADWLLLATHDVSAVTLEASGPGPCMIPAIQAAGWTLVQDRQRFRSAHYNVGHLWLFRRG